MTRIAPTPPDWYQDLRLLADTWSAARWLRCLFENPEHPVHDHLKRYWTARLDVSEHLEQEVSLVVGKVC